MLLLTLLASLAGGWLFLKKKIPGGMMVGAIAASAFMSLVFQAGSMPPAAKTIAQITAGAYIASGIHLEDLKHISRIVKPALVLLSLMLLSNVFLGFVISSIGGVDLLTGLLCAVPGGVSNVPLIAADLGADVPKVAAMQICRLAGCMALMPALIKRAHRSEKAEGQAHGQDDLQCPEKHEMASAKALVITSVVGGLAGLCGKLLGVPAGTMLFSLLGVLVLKWQTCCVYLPLKAALNCPRVIRRLHRMQHPAKRLACVGRTPFARRDSIGRVYPDLSGQQLAAQSLFLRYNGGGQGCRHTGRCQRYNRDGGRSGCKKYKRPRITCFAKIGGYYLFLTDSDACCKGFG